MSRQVYGLQPVREAVRVHGSAVERLGVQQDAGPKIEALARFARDQGINVERLSRADLDRHTRGGRHQGVLALAPELFIAHIDALTIDDKTLIVVLDGVMDPQNFGAVVRSSVAMGATAVMWPEHSSAPLSPAMFRASAGAVEHATLCRVSSLPEALQSLSLRGVTTVALDAAGTVELSDVDLTGPSALVIGAEDKGARKAVRASCAHVARLPMPGPINSLNASVAGAIALYEVTRQRLGAKPR